MAHNPPRYEWRPVPCSGRLGWKLWVNRRPVGRVLYGDVDGEGYYLAMLGNRFVGDRWPTLIEAQEGVEQAYIEQRDWMQWQR